MASMYRLGAILVAFLALSAAQCSSTPPPAPKPPANSWLVLLCRASDVPAEPQTVAFYQALFRPGPAGVLHDYFNRVSAGRVDLSGSQVFGWFQMPVTSAELDPAVRNAGTAVTRSQTAQDCRNAGLVALATTSPVDPADFVGIITVINVPVDSGAAGGKFVVLANQGENDAGFVIHEMLHVLGLNHSRKAAQDTSPDHRWNAGGDVDYQDCWDIMSFATCVFRSPSSRGLPTENGPELSGAHLQMLGWMPTDRVRDVATSGTVDLAPIGDPSRPGFLVANVDVPGRGGHYSVEYREPVRFDAGIPRPAVLIREVRGKRTYLVHRQNGRRDWTAGETFTDTQNFLSIRVDQVGNGGARVTFNTFFAPSPLPAGAICGNRERGDIAQCVAPAVCRPRQLSGGLQTSDWYCD